MIRKILIGIALLIVIPVAALLAYHVATPGSGSVQMKAMKVALRAFGKVTDPPEHIAKLRTQPPAADPMPAAFSERYTVTSATLQGRQVVTLAPKTAPSRWHVIYTHGGAFVAPITGVHWSAIDEFSRRTGATITVPLYGVAPAHTYRQAYPFLREVYEQVLKRTPAERVVLAGDSAGGNLALEQAIMYRDAGLPQPGRVILFAPWLDLGLADPAARAVEARDPMLDVDVLRADAALWAPGESLSSPRISPLYANLRDLPPIDLFQGTDDLFLPDARNLVRKIKQSGGQIGYYEYPGGFHVFMGVTFLPESKDVMTKVAAALPRQ